jgi:polysaccharide biosynthesis protein PslG
MRARVAFAVALLATAALAACGGGARGDGDRDREGGQGHANDPFYGVISAEPLPDAPMLARLGKGGAGTLRVNLAWIYAQAGPTSAYDWSHYDGVVAEAARNGIRVLATVYGSPSWVEPRAENPPLGASLFRFAAFARAAVQRYGTKGSFWMHHPDLPKLPITNWQLWNEPNFSLFWKPAPDPSSYLELLRPFHAAVKEADPEANVLLGGVFPTPRDDPTMESFISALYRAGARGLFDAAAIHPYSATPDDALRRVAELRALMRRFGDDDKPIWITEVGWASAGAPSGLTVGPERQSDYLTRTFELAAASRERLGIAGVVWYSLTDAPGPLWVGHCGLFTLDGAAKPSWEAFAGVAGGDA